MSATLVFGSVCSGIGAAELAWTRLGWECAFSSEIEAFPRAVLSHRYPEAPLHGDFTTIQAGQYRAIDVLVGGTPCQGFSIAGLRGGLEDERSNLALEFIRLAQRLQPRWIVFENVPGIYSSLSHNAPDPCPPPNNMEEGSEWVGSDEYDADENHAFGCFLAGLSELGYGFAYRALDAQYAGLAQRRERVFLVASLGDWRRAGQVLFERESLLWNPPPRRETRQDVAGTLSARTEGGGGLGTDFELGGGLVPGIAAFGGNNQSGPIDVSTALNACGTASGRQDFETETFLVDIAHTLRGEGFDASEDGTGRGTPLVPIAFQSNAGGQNGEVYYDLSPTIKAQSTGGSGMPAIAFSSKNHGADATLDLAPTMRAMGHNGSHANGGGQLGVATASAVRRLTPLECCRLQGFPDDYLDIEYRGKPAADGPKYKALGNSMAVPLLKWIGEGIGAVDAAWRA